MVQIWNRISRSISGSILFKNLWGIGAADPVAYLPLDPASDGLYIDAAADHDPDSVARTSRSRTLHKMKKRRGTRCFFALVGLAVFLFVCLALGLGLGLGLEDDENGNGDEEGPVKDLGYARYRGTNLGNGVSQYLGMRYARPPTGDLRWRKPAEPERQDYDEIQSAKEFGPICLGDHDPLDGKRDEDCLYANIWAPTNATADMKLPVVVFIQGGGYTRSANANWNASRIVETSGNNLVWVSFTYRVGLFGFLAGEEVREDGDLNAGLLDQRFLLHWVQKHISKFGGDPDHVVIQGISAGAGSVALHLAAYGGRDDHLFVGAISQALFLPHHPTVSALEYQFDRLVDSAGCGEAQSRMSCLRGKSLADLQALNVGAPFPGREKSPHFYWTPCVDGEFLEDHPSALYSDNKFLKVPSLFGTSTNEGSIFAPKSLSSSNEFISYLKDQFPNITSSQQEKLLDHYPKDIRPSVKDHSDWYPSAALAYGEAVFVCPTDNFLDALSLAFSSNSSSSSSSSPPPLYSYRYDVEDVDVVASGKGVPHTSESAAIFGPDMLPSHGPASYYTSNADVVPLVMNYFISFARTLDPNVHKLEDGPLWGTWDEGRNRMLFQTQNADMENVGDQEQGRCSFWNSIQATTKQ